VSACNWATPEGRPTVKASASFIVGWKSSAPPKPVAGIYLVAGTFVHPPVADPAEVAAL
jgi:hypothetical protein